REEVRLGFLGGSGIYDLKLLEEPAEVEVDTPYGRPSGPLHLGSIGGRKVAFLSRHGEGHRIPAHRLSHKANIRALKDIGVEKLVSTSSVGSLKKEIEPGSFLVPDDFFSPWKIVTFFDEEVKHITPSFDEELRQGLIGTARDMGFTVHDKGTYVQAIGPRLETRAEIRAMSGFGDAVGMTVASETTLANELDIGYASLCMVDNYCHGLVERPLTYEDIVESQKKSSENAKALITRFLGGLQ
ncbi:MAG: MTAP family purine nucleoside phosphorylase, partial [Thermoplasmata archaeon]|nr:MTAP family purine nucleoside phosphorylase [Thermoplasmata archaeon]